MPLIDHLDHIVLTSIDPEATQHFNTKILQMRMETFEGGRVPLGLRAKRSTSN